MKAIVRRLAISLLLSIIVLSPFNVLAQTNDSKCLICHGKKDFNTRSIDGRVRSLYVDTSKVAESVHARWGCTDCHASVTSIPHQLKVERVECIRCHYSGNKVGAPQGEMYDQYRESVHGIEVTRGTPNAPSCQDCHGTHEIKRHTDPSSPIYKSQLTTTCGRCHVNESAQYVSSIHGTEVAKGNPDSPTCIHCHGEHDIRMRSDPESKVNTSNVLNTCSACHGSEAIMDQYGVRTRQIDTYTDSFHGIAIKFGQKQAANCSSCHGVHDILPATDPRSSINPENIPATCGKCHDNANANYARGRIHVDTHDPESGVIYYISMFFKWLTTSTLIGLIFYILLDLRKRIFGRKE